jgi:hypothetical protein
MGSEALHQRSDSAVNNFARTGRRERDLGSCFRSVVISGTDFPLAIPRTGRPSLLTTSRSNDFELID